MPGHPGAANRRAAAACGREERVRRKSTVNFRPGRTGQYFGTQAVGPASYIGKIQILKKPIASKAFNAFVRATI
jgi:hypothetical protein